MDSTENYARMRLKLKRNRFPRDYSDAKRVTAEFEEKEKEKEKEENRILALGKNLIHLKSTLESPVIEEGEEWNTIEPEIRIEAKIA